LNDSFESFHAEVTTPAKSKVSKRDAAVKIQRKFRQHSISQDRKSGMMSAERKRLTPLLILETVDGKKITVTSTWSGTVLVALKIN
jgi:hypothetical protein